MRLNPLFCDGAVFAANKPIRIFGTGGGNVKISLCGNTAEGSFIGEKWCLELPPMQYGGPYLLEVELDGRKQALHDIYIGDVYIIAGQSNAQLKVAETVLAPELYKSDCGLRLFSTERVEPGEHFLPQDGWVNADRETVGNWSAVGYTVGMLLRKKTEHVIGIIACYQGAAAIQAYMPEDAFDEPQLNIPDEERFDLCFTWNIGHSGLYRFQVGQLIPFSVSAVVWYQGESNYSEKESRVYLQMLTALIDGWRRDFKDELLPFAVVQIADFIHRNGEPWHIIQAAQAEAPSIRENVRTVISRDVSDNTDIHPRDKYQLSVRIADVLYNDFK